MNTKPLLVLASNSPRRRQLLAMGGWMFSVSPAEVDESVKTGEAAGDYVLRLAQSKACTCAAPSHRDQVIIAADTAVVNGKDILGKPKTKADAADMLKQLRGRTHQVYTGIAALCVADDQLLTDLCITDVPMRDYDDREIDTYIATGDPLDKAGAYAIQHPQFKPVNSLHGCYASVMGLPICHLQRILRQIDVPPAADIPGNCQLSFNYQCPISSAVLRGERVG